MAERPPVIDADGHIRERERDIRLHLEPPWDRRQTSLHPGSDQPWDTDLFDRQLGYDHLDYPRGIGPAEQVEIWHKLMDQYGIESAMLFPTGSASATKLREREFCVAVCRAANNHFARDYNALSERVHAVGILPLAWPDEAAKELRRAVTEEGLLSFELVTLGLPTALGDTMYDPLYAEAERLNVPLSIHGTRGSTHQIGADSLSTFSEVHTYAFAVGILLQFTSVIFQGVPVRFPRLRLAFLEAGATWIPYWLDRMNEHWELRGDIESPLLKKKPSQVVQESPIYFSLEAEESLLPQTVEYLGDDHFMYASDIPHWDGGFPKNLHELWEHPALSRESKEKILYHNAKAFFGLKSPVHP